MEKKKVFISLGGLFDPETEEAEKLFSTRYFKGHSYPAHLSAGEVVASECVKCHSLFIIVSILKKKSLGGGCEFFGIQEEGKFCPICGSKF